jgi:hypothetical protein
MPGPPGDGVSATVLSSGEDASSFLLTLPAGDTRDFRFIDRDILSKGRTLDPVFVLIFVDGFLFRAIVIAERFEDF